MRFAAELASEELATSAMHETHGVSAVPTLSVQIHLRSDKHVALNCEVKAEHVV